MNRLLSKKHLIGSNDRVGFLHFKSKLPVKVTLHLLSYFFKNDSYGKSSDRVYDNESGFSHNPVCAIIH